MRKKHRSGFSLVELSIVLVILGLLVGGVLGGQSLIKAAELRAITTEFAQWQTAVNAFRQRFMQYPGDFSQATRVWGTDSCPPASGSTLTNTCNGNGNGKIAVHNFGNSETSEYFLFWQHLSKAGLVPGTFTGAPGTIDEWDHDPGENIPTSRYNGAAWSIETHEELDGHPSHFWDVRNLPLKNAFFFAASSDSMLESILTPEDAWGIDMKMDDGKPARGNVIAMNYATCTDAVAGNDTDYDADYDLARTTLGCFLYFRNGI